jgi:hypothetical protein
MANKIAPTQNQLVLDHLITTDHLTQLQAIGVYGIYRLAGRVWELNKWLEGSPYAIETEMVRDPRGKSYARYRLTFLGARLTSATRNRAKQELSYDAKLRSVA